MLVLAQSALAGTSQGNCHGQGHDKRDIMYKSGGIWHHFDLCTVADVSEVVFGSVDQQHFLRNVGNCSSLLSFLKKRTMIETACRVLM
jgi:hypothetical protein